MLMAVILSSSHNCNSIDSGIYQAESAQLEDNRPLITANCDQWNLITNYYDNMIRYR